MEALFVYMSIGALELVDPKKVFRDEEGSIHIWVLDLLCRLRFVSRCSVVSI